MKTHTKTLLTALTTSAMISGSASAATIVYNFNGDTATGDGATSAVDSNDFGSGVTAGDFTLVDGNGSGSFVDGFHQDRLEIVLKGDDTISTFTVTIPNGVIVDLTSLSFDDGIDWDANRANDTYSFWDLSIDNGGAATPATVTNVAVGSSGIGDFKGNKNNVLALSGLTGLTNTTVTFTINGTFSTNTDRTGGNDKERQAYIDNLTLTGSAVPEPGSLALMGLGGLLIASRRRRDA